MITNKKDKVVLGLSGGVDSASAAFLLKEKYDVIGVTIKVWEDFDASDAIDVAKQLDIPHYIVDVREAFSKVKENFLEEYTNGRTPNPCVLCNPMVKWEALLRKADELGAKYVATGHYANIKKLDNDRYTILRSKNNDQSYVLYRLSQENLARTLFPLGSFVKDEVREIAKEANISIFEKPDSQEICFIPDDDYISFIEENKSDLKEIGDFIDSEGNILGKHKGIHRYTIGQRRGLDLALGKRVYVKEINKEKNQVILAEDKDLYNHSFLVSSINFMGIEDIKEEEVFFIKIRYNHKGAKGKVYRDKEGIRCEFMEAQRGITPGQSAVFYKEDSLAFGGIIEKVL